MALTGVFVKEPLALLTLDAWLLALQDHANPLRVHERFFGEASRTDAWTCRDRCEPWHFIYLALEGRSFGTAEGMDITMEPGQLLWIPPYVQHDFTWTRVFRYVEVWFALGHEQALATPLDRPIVLPAAMEARPLLDRIAEELSFRRPFHEHSLRSLLCMLTVELFRLRENHKITRHGLTPGERDRLARFVHRNIGEPLVPADLAAEIDMSADYFSRRFRESFGCSPRSWLMSERIRSASRLLSGSQLRIFQIATQLGYADVPQFSRQFKAVTGMSPQTFRNTSLSAHPADYTPPPPQKIASRQNR